MRTEAERREVVHLRERTLITNGVPVSALKPLKQVANELAAVTPMSPYTWYLKLTKNVLEQFLDVRSQLAQGLDPR
jgi:hypothetical protein